MFNNENIIIFCSNNLYNINAHFCIGQYLKTMFFINTETYEEDIN